MRFFKDKQNAVHCLNETDFTPEKFEKITFGLEELTAQQADLILNPPKTLEQAKTEVNLKINANRNELERGEIEYLSKIFDGDSISAQRITSSAMLAQLAAAAGQDFSVDWTTKDNSTITLDAQKMVGLAAEIAKRSQELHAKALSLKTRLNALKYMAQVQEFKVEF